MEFNDFFCLKVGIYGYTAYSATKFGLRGLAEALQQEVITDGIHVSLVCPPETDTDTLLQGTLLTYVQLEALHCWECKTCYMYLQNEREGLN